jgi:hypothetical protein
MSKIVYFGIASRFFSEFLARRTEISPEKMLLLFVISLYVCYNKSERNMAWTNVTLALRHARSFNKGKKKR